MGKILKDYNITISNISLHQLSLYPLYTVSVAVFTFIYIFIHREKYNTRFRTDLDHGWQVDGNVQLFIISHQKMMSMLGKLEYKVNHAYRFQIYSQISHKSNIFVDIRFPVIN